jgi:hypothetical protein
VPWASKRQARWGHSEAGKKALGGPAAVAEWDASTPKGSLTDKAPGAIGAAFRKRKGKNNGRA